MGEKLIGKVVIFHNDDNTVYGMITGYDDFSKEYYVNGLWLTIENLNFK